MKEARLHIFICWNWSLRASRMDVKCVCAHTCVGVTYRAWIWIRLIQTWEQSHHVEPVLLQSDLHPRGLTVITSAFIGNNLRNRRADWLDKSETLGHSLSDHTHTHTGHSQSCWTGALSALVNAEQNENYTDCRWALELRSLNSLLLTISKNYGSNCFLNASEENRRCTCLWFSSSRFANK